MEILILAWYILVATDSPFLVGVLGALRFSGTLTAPIVGVIADRVSRKVMLMVLRTGAGLSAVALLLLAAFNLIEPWHVFVIAGISGFFRPADNVLRRLVVASATNDEMAHWLGSAAIHTICELKIEELYPQLLEASRRPDDSLARETAIWAGHRLGLDPT